MRTYYIYMLELQLENENEKNKTKNKYYVGKSQQLEVRLNDHISRNRKSVKSWKADYKVIAIKEVHKILGIKDIKDAGELDNPGDLDSITSRLENKVVTEKINEAIESMNGSESTADVDRITSRLENKLVTTKTELVEKMKLKYCGGNFVKDLKCKRYKEELEKYSPIKATTVEYEVTEDNKDEIVKKLMSDLEKFEILLSRNQ